MPSGPAARAVPPLLVTEQPDGYAVTLCDLAAPAELNLFATVEDLLRGRGRCMAQQAGKPQLRQRTLALAA